MQQNQNTADELTDDEREHAVATLCALNGKLNNTVHGYAVTYKGERRIVLAADLGDAQGDVLLAIVLTEADIPEIEGAFLFDATTEEGAA